MAGSSARPASLVASMILGLAYAAGGLAAVGAFFFGSRLAADPELGPAGASEMLWGLLPGLLVTGCVYLITAGACAAVFVMVLRGPEQWRTWIAASLFLVLAVALVDLVRAATAGIGAPDVTVFTFVVGCVAAIWYGIRRSASAAA